MIKSLQIIAFSFLGLFILSFSGNQNFASATNNINEDYKFNGSQIIRVDGEEKNREGINTSVSEVIIAIIKFATQIIGTIAVVILIVGGLMMILSQGNDNTISQGKDIIKYAVMGLVVTFLSYVIVTFVQSFVTEKVQAPPAPIEDSSVSPDLIPPDQDPQMTA